MGDIYATPDAELGQSFEGERAGGNIDDAVAGNFKIEMIATLGEAWSGLKGFKLKCLIALALYLVVFIGIHVCYYLVAFALSATNADATVLGVLNIVFQLIATAVGLPMSLAILVMAMRHANQKSVSSGEVFRHFGVIGTLILTYLLMIVLLAFGFVLLVLPGIYLMFAYMYAMPLVLEKKMGVWQALETSRKALTKVWFRLVGLMLLIFVINIAGIFTIVGWIWTLPWTTLTMAMVYQKIFGVEAHSLAD